MNCFEYCVPFAIMFFLHILILYHLLEEVIFTLYYLYTTTKKQKSRVDPMYHEKIDHLLDTYARKLAENMNQGFAIDARVPSVMIAGPANFPVGKKEKQNRARDSNMEEWRYIQGLLDKIRSTGMGGISADDPAVIEKLQKKLDGLERSQLIMKEVNAYYRKHGKLDGCALLSPDQIEKLKASMASPEAL